MHFTIQVVITNEQGSETLEEVIQLEKNVADNNTVGLTLSDSKQILKVLQAKIVLEQAKNRVELQKTCLCCKRKRWLKDYHSVQFRTLFGTVNIPSPRFLHCQCDSASEKTFSPINQWLFDKNSPELQYIETKWASLMSYQYTAKLLKEILPIEPTQNASTVRNHLQKVARRKEKELEDKPEYITGCPAEWEKLPKPGKPIIVGIDGGYLTGWHQKNKKFEIIAGKSFSETQPSKRFGFVQTLDDHPRKRLMYNLTRQGMQANQQIIFLSDGADHIRDLQYRMYPESEHILDWFHITMRLTVLNQFTKGLLHSDPKPGKEVQKNLESIKWYLWHGNVKEALSYIEDCSCVFLDEDLKYPNRKKMASHLDELQTYIENNRYLIPNYGEKWRCKEAIATGFVESTVNEVVAKRMVKKQQMQWTAKGAHYLLQTRVAVLNNELSEDFSRWYPGFHINNDGKPDAEKAEVLKMSKVA